MIAKLRYVIGIFSGIVQVECTSDEEDSEIIIRAREALRNKVGDLPVGCSESWRILKRTENSI